MRISACELRWCACAQRIHVSHMQLNFRGETKLLSMSTRSGVRRPLNSPSPVGDELVLDHPGRQKTCMLGRGRVALAQPGVGQGWMNWRKGCEVEVKIPLVPELALMSPRPGVALKQTCGWKPLLRTSSSGIWVLPGALRCEWFLAALAAAGAALTAQLGRYIPGQVANARTRTGKAQLSGHILDVVAFATNPVCGGLSHSCCRRGVWKGMCHLLRT